LAEQLRRRRASIWRRRSAEIRRHDTLFARAAGAELFVRLSMFLRVARPARWDDVVNRVRPPARERNTVFHDERLLLAAIGATSAICLDQSSPLRRGECTGRPKTSRAIPL